MNSLISDKLELTELANKLFMYTDARQWNLLESEVFIETIEFDMQSSSGQPAAQMQATEVCNLWKNGFEGIDAVHHQGGHYLVKVEHDKADIYAYAVATHYKKEAKEGNTRSFTGSYDLKAIKTTHGWRLSHFKYNLKFSDGNVAFK